MFLFLTLKKKQEEISLGWGDQLVSGSRSHMCDPRDCSRPWFLCARASMCVPDEVVMMMLVLTRAFSTCVHPRDRGLDDMTTQAGKNAVDALGGEEIITDEALVETREGEAHVAADQSEENDGATVSAGLRLRQEGLEPPPELPPPPIANGWAVALSKLGVFPTKQDAIERLDQERDQWTTLPPCHPQTVRFLGVRSVSWHPQIVQRAVVKAGWHLFACSGRNLICIADEGLIVRLPDSSVVEIDIHSPNRSLHLIIYGRVNPRYLRGTTWTDSFDPDDSDDTPATRPDNWVHATAIKNGKLQPEYGLPIALKWLHVTDGGVDSINGYFHAIDTIYVLKPPVIELSSDSDCEVVETSPHPSDRTRYKRSLASAFGVSGVLSSHKGPRLREKMLDELSRNRLRLEQDREGDLVTYAEVEASRVV